MFYYIRQHASSFLLYPTAWILRADYNKSDYFLFWKEKMHPLFFVLYHNNAAHIGFSIYP